MDHRTAGIFVGLGLLAVLFVATSGSTNRSPSGSRYGIIEPGHRWSKSRLKVCVAGSPERVIAIFARSQEVDASENYQFSQLFRPLSDRDFEAVKSVVTSEFSVKETGIAFEGWEICPDDLNTVDVVLMPIRMPRKKVTDPDPMFGESDIGPRDGRPAVVFFAPGSHEDAEAGKKLIQFQALHEFGHVVGLRHEHLLKATAGEDSPLADPVCRILNPGSLLEPDVIPEEQLVGKPVTTYDRNSVMNYCLGNLLALTRTSPREKVHAGGATLDLQRFSDFLGGQSLLASGYFRDPRNSRVKFSGVSADEVEVAYEFLPRLSSGDVRALRCLYGLEPETACNQVPISGVRPSSGFAKDAKISVKLDSAVVRKLRDQVRKSRDANGLWVVFEQGQARIIADKDLLQWRLKPHCRRPAKDVQRWSKKTLTFPMPGMDSPLAAVLGKRTVDLETRFGSWICSSDLEIGELRLTSQALQSIFGRDVQIR